MHTDKRAADSWNWGMSSGLTNNVHNGSVSLKCPTAAMQDTECNIRGGTEEIVTQLLPVLLVTRVVHNLKYLWKHKFHFV